MRNSILLLAALAVTASGASAQTLAQQTRRVGGTIDGPSHIISANPFLPLLGYFAGEYEQRLTPVVSFAISGSHVKPDRSRYTNIDAKARLYPSETALSGFNIAASMGVSRIDATDGGICAVDTVCPLAKPFTTGSFAIEVGYQLLLGPSQVTAVTVGGGAKRFLGGDSKFDGVERVIPTLRLSIGYAF